LFAAKRYRLLRVSPQD